MKSSLRRVITLLLGLLLFACSSKGDLSINLKGWKEEVSERIQVFLSEVPLIKRWVTLPKPPKELYRETEAKIALLKLSRAKDLYADDYRRIMQEWESAKGKYEKKFYRSAERELKRTYQAAEDLFKRVEDHERALKEEALKRYKEKEAKLLAKLSKDERENLKIKLYLWRLRNLIELGQFDEFERELERAPF